MHQSRNLRTLMIRASAMLLLTLLSPVVPARHHSPGAAVIDAPGHFDYYLLALSWSPSYCIVHPGDRNQCQSRGFGFVLHGLWPQFNAGGYPQSCATNVGVDRTAEQVGRTLYPSPQLMAHEWQRHGTCSGLDPAEYFRTADRATAVWPIPHYRHTP
jgi:ribonuclease T2